MKDFEHSHGGYLSSEHVQFFGFRSCYNLVAVITYLSLLAHINRYDLLPISLMKQILNFETLLSRAGISPETPDGEFSALPAPELALEHLDTLWLQVSGTLCNLACLHCFISCGPKNNNHEMMTL